ncbi:MAG: hypothetical protein M3158_01205 [Pseudomonadota bacterium]|nr:hypothetical protein [Pseudomonadota bacterium]
MSENQKNEANSPSSTTGTSGQNKGTGSGSDTLSAAKISAGTSVGNVGQSPMPQSASGSGAGSSGGTSAQSGTLASHTSKPMGGTGGTGASATQGSSGGQGGQQGGAQALGGQSSGGQSAGGTMDQAKGMAGQAAEAASGIADQAAEWARDTYEQASEMASGAFRQGTRGLNRRGGRPMKGVRNAGSGVQRYVAENPVMVGLIGLATGLLIGALLPRTRREDEAFGEWADEVREQGLRYAHEMAQRGRDFVEESFSGDDPRFAHHESEYRAGGRGDANRH